MGRGLIRIPHRSKLIRRYTTTLLLLFFVWDLHLDSTPHVHTVPDCPAIAGVCIAGGGQEHSDTSHPDCGMPDHDCALAHHHHFPALLGHTSFAVLESVLRVRQQDKVTSAERVPLSGHPIRAPPSA